MSLKFIMYQIFLLLFPLDLISPLLPVYLILLLVYILTVSRKNPKKRSFTISNVVQTRSLTCFFSSTCQYVFSKIPNVFLISLLVSIRTSSPLVPSTVASCSHSEKVPGSSYYYSCSVPISSSRCSQNNIF